MNKVEKEIYEIVYTKKDNIYGVKYQKINSKIQILHIKFFENLPYKVYFLYENKEAYEKDEYRILYEGQILTNYIPKK